MHLHPQLEYYTKAFFKSHIFYMNYPCNFIILFLHIQHIIKRVRWSIHSIVFPCVTILANILYIQRNAIPKYYKQIMTSFCEFYFGIQNHLWSGIYSFCVSSYICMTSGCYKFQHKPQKNVIICFTPTVRDGCYIGTRRYFEEIWYIVNL